MRGSLKAAASVTALALLAACLGRCSLGHSTAFLLPAGLASQRSLGAPLPAPAAALPGAEESAARSDGLGAGACSLGLAAAAALLAAVRHSSKVTMHAAARRYKPCVKGMKPMIHRKLARDVIKDNYENWIGQKKVKTKDFMENLVKTHLHGKLQIQFSSEHFTDSEPLCASVQATKGSMGMRLDHLYDDPFYVRKFLDPSKFKKLAIACWEMPDSYTRAVTLRELVDAGVQYGHKSNKWNPAMLPYLYADNEGTHIFDLVQTAAAINRACYYCMEAAAMGAEFIFVGTKAQARPVIQKCAEDVGAHYADDKFVGGVITNFAVIRKAVNLLKQLVEARDQGGWNNYDANLRMSLTAKIRRLNRKYHGMMEMERMPDICIFVDEVKERNAIAEMTRIGIPCIGMIDSNSDPKYVDIPIAGNCSGSRSIDLVIGKLSEAIKKGKMIRETTEEGNRAVIPKEWDPWIFSRDRIRWIRRRSKRQPWMKALYKNYENWKACHPYGAIPTVMPFHDFSWNDAMK